MNKVMLVGRLGNDPKVSDGGKVKAARFSIATNKLFKKGSEWKEVTSWHQVVCFSNVAARAEKNLRQGVECFVDGELQTRSYEKDGRKQYVTEVIANYIKPFESGQSSVDPDEVISPGEDMPF